MTWLVASLLVLQLVRGQQPLLGKTVDEIMNMCIDGQNHKSQPGPESSLFNHCKPWAKRSCCTAETAQGIAIDRRWLNFDWHHCQPLSPVCTQQFVQDLCFYECSPNVGPYLVTDVRKIRKNRYRDVPLCQNTCEYWWNACKSDYTCTDNWTRNFNWTTGKNRCPTDSKCDTFQNVFGNAKNFCEKIWDRGFKVVPDTDECFRLWFSPDENPNEVVARRAAARLLAVSRAASDVSSSQVIVYSVPLLSWIIWLLCRS